LAKIKETRGGPPSYMGADSDGTQIHLPDAKPHHAGIVGDYTGSSPKVPKPSDEEETKESRDHEPTIDTAPVSAAQDDRAAALSKTGGGKTRRTKRTRRKSGKRSGHTRRKSGKRSGHTRRKSGKRSGHTRRKSGKRSGHTRRTKRTKRTKRKSGKHRK
jgi:hypothetical protein